MKLREKYLHELFTSINTGKKKYIGLLRINKQGSSPCVKKYGSVCKCEMQTNFEINISKKKVGFYSILNKYNPYTDNKQRRRLLVGTKLRCLIPEHILYKRRVVYDHHDFLIIKFAYEKNKRKFNPLLKNVNGLILK